MTPQDSQHIPAATAAPRTVMKLAPAERMVVAMIRQVAAGKGFTALADLAEAQGTCAGRSASIARHGHALAQGLDDPDGPDLNVHAIPCRRLSDDEVTVLRLLAASQSGDTASADLYAGCLVGAGRVTAVLRHARQLARAFADASLGFSVCAAAPQVALPRVA